MTATYSPNLGIELIGTGDQAGTWGATTNTNLGTLLEQAISGYVQTSVFDGDNYLAIAPGVDCTARNMFIECTGAISVNSNVIVDATPKLYFIYNNTTGGFTLTVKVSGQTGVAVPAGAKALLVCDGTDVVDSINHMSELSLSSPLPVSSGGTGVFSVPAGNVVVGNGTGSLQSVAATTAGNVLFSTDGVEFSSVGKLTSTTTSASGTSVDFTGIPSWAKRITILFNGLSSNGNDTYIVQAGNGSYTTSGYLSYYGEFASGGGQSGSVTSGFGVWSANSVDVHYITMTLNLSNTSWVSSHSGGMYNGSTNFALCGGGSLALGGPIDRIRVTTTGGTNTFDAGSITVTYE
jgi:hypothetical protein